MLNRQEIITSLHEPTSTSWPSVQIESGFGREPRYVRGALSGSRTLVRTTRRSSFNLQRLLERARHTFVTHRENRAVQPST